MRLTRRLPAMLAVFLLTGCTRDAGRDVRPMASPLGAAVSGPAAGEVLPLDQVRKSQAAAVAQRIAHTEVIVTYSRPVARGRDLFGALVPYDQVWNPGADQATAIAFNRALLINGHAIPAGKYSIWVIPRIDAWTVIFSAAADVYHTPYPGEGRDVLRIDVPVESGPHAEVLAFDFPVVEGKAAVLRLHWGTVAIPLSIQVS